MPEAEPQFFSSDPTLLLTEVSLLTFSHSISTFRAVLISGTGSVSGTPTVETPQNLRFICQFNIKSAGTFQNYYLVHATGRYSSFTHVTRNNMANRCLYNQRVTSPCPFQRNSVLECSAQWSDMVRTNQKLYWTLSASCLFSQADKNSHAFVLRRIRLRSQLISPRFQKEW